jgi:hypothetical protein
MLVVDGPDTLQGVTAIWPNRLDQASVKDFVARVQIIALATQMVSYPQQVAHGTHVAHAGHI